MPIQVTSSLVLADSEFSESFVRASGPGGQNVNKVATAVQLRLHVGRVSLPDAARARLRILAGSRLTTDDELVVEAREHRTQAQNREAARERLADLIRRALVRPKSRRKTAPTRASKERRLEGKARRSRIKRARRADDD
ncbi:MAG: alternative ribosome rescue aminoacyl-tRNA hydrolase ArfB [Acidobacteriota bacterium]